MHIYAFRKKRHNSVESHNKTTVRCFIISLAASFIKVYSRCNICCVHGHIQLVFPYEYQLNWTVSRIFKYHSFDSLTITKCQVFYEELESPNAHYVSNSVLKTCR